MLPFLLGAAALALFVFAMRGSLKLDPRTLAGIARTSLVVALAGIAVVLFLRDMLAAGLALTLVAAALNFLWREPRPFPWRRQEPAPRAQGAMSRAEALSVLGLQPGASAEEIRAAHKRLMLQTHPDKGGTDYLAAKINQAKDVLLG